MATYRIQGPDGKNYEFDAPSGLTSYQVDLIRDGLFEQPKPVAPPPAPKTETGFIPSVMRGGRGIYSLLGDVAPAMLGKLVGAEDYAKRQMREAAEYQKETERLYPAAVPSFTDIKDIGSALTYVKEAIGEALPSIIPSIFTGGAAALASRGAVAAAEKAAQGAAARYATEQLVRKGGEAALTQEALEGVTAGALKAGQEAAKRVALQYEVGGTLAGSAAQNIPEVYQNLYEKGAGELPDLAPALVSGGFNAVLDAITPIQILRKAKLSGIPDEQIIGAWYKRAGIGAAKGFFTEGGTEALQEMSSAAAESFVNQNSKFFTPENFVRFIDAGLKGGFGGAAITGVADVAFGRAAEKPPAGVEPGAADALVKTLGEGEAGVTEPQPTTSRGGFEIFEQPAEPAAPQGVAGVEQPRVVPAQPDVAAVVGGERAAPSAVAPTPTPVPAIEGKKAEAPVTPVDREGYWRPNPREPENKNSWQDNFGFVHYDVNHPLPKGGRVVNLVDGQQGEQILLGFVNSKGEKKTVALRVRKGKVPYWFAGDLSEEQLKKGLGDELYNLAGKEPVEDYEAFFNKVRAAIKTAPTPAAPAPAPVAKEAAPAPTPIPEGYKPYSEWMAERKKAMPPTLEPEPYKAPTPEEMEQRRKSIKKEIAKDERTIGKYYDQERMASRFEDEASKSLYEATEKGELPVDQQPGTRRFDETLLKNGLVPDLYALPEGFSQFTPEQQTEYKKGIARDVHAELKDLYGKRAELPEWNKMTRDGKDVFLANMTENTPEERARARMHLRDYLNRVAQVQGTTRTKTTAAPEARIYETNRTTYNKFEGVNFPLWNELTDEQRKLFTTSLRKYSPEQKSARGTSVQHDFAFKSLGNVLKEERDKVEAEKKKKTVPPRYEEAQKEIAEKQETETKKKVEPTVEVPFSDEVTKKKEYESEEKVKAARKEREEKAKKREATTKVLREAIEKNDIKRVLNFINANSKIPVHRLVAQRILQGAAAMKTKISFVDNLPEGHVAEYDPKTDEIRVTEDGLNNTTLLHELVHAVTVRTIYKYYSDNKSLTDAERDAVEQLLDVMEVAKKEIGDLNPQAFKDLYEFVSHAMSDVGFQRELARVKTDNLEFSELPQKFSLWTDFLKAVSNLFPSIMRMFDKKGKLKENEANLLAETFNAFEQIMSVPEGGVEMAPFPATMTLPAGKAPSELTQEEFIQKALDSVKLKEHGGKAFLQHLMSTRGYEWLVTKFQNERRAVKLPMDRAALFDMLVKVGENVNDVYGEITASTSMAVHLFKTELQNLEQDLHNAIAAYADKRGKTLKEVLAELHLILEARHEPERRLVKFLLRVPLDNDNDKKYSVKGFDGTRSAEGWREFILEQLTRTDIKKEEVKKLRGLLEDFALDPKGRFYSKVITKTDKNGRATTTIIDEEAAKNVFNPNSELYNVIGNRSAQDIARIKNAFDTPAMKKEIDAVAKAIKAIQEKTIDLNKESNYWSAPVQNIKEFYGYDNYVPFKGRPKGQYDEEFELDSRRIGGELQDLPISFDGRLSESENPLLQTLAEGAQAAMRAGRKDLTLSIKNAIKDGILEGKKKPVATISFADRYLRGAENENLKGEDKIFHYLPDGTIEIWKLDNKAQSEAIRRSYRTAQPLIDIANSITSMIGQGHTRYNPAFAPVDFVRNSLTNAFLVGAELGPEKAAKLISAVATDVATGGLHRSFKFAQLYANGKFGEIDRLAGGKTPYNELDSTQKYYRDLIDYVRRGKVSYLQGVAAKGALDGLMKEIGRSGILKSKDQVDKFFDIYNDTFELASRVAAYRALKDDFIRNAKTDKERNEAQVRAIEITKNLANFEQVGQWGKAAGAAFMFFRPAATGAVRAIDALRPMFGFDEDTFRQEAKAEGRTDAQIESAIEKLRQQTKDARHMAAALAGAGVAMYLAAMMLSDDDEAGRNRVATDDMARWTRYARFFIPGFEKPIQIPWAFGPGAFAAAGAQVASLASGRVRLGDAMTNIMTIGLDSFLPLPFSRISPLDNFPAFAVDSVTPSALRPFFEYVMNLDGLGREIYNNRQSRYGDAYTGGDSIPEIYKSVARTLFNATNGKVDWSPNTLYFFTSNYIDGAAKMTSSGYNMGLTLMGQKDFDLKNDALFFGSFIGSKSNVDAREFSRAETYIKGLDKRINAIKDKPEMFAEYARENPENIALVQAYNQQVNGGLRMLREAANKVRVDRNLTYGERKAQLEQIINLQNAVKRNMLAMFDSVAGYRP